MKLGIIGDLHANTLWAKSIIEQCAEQKCELLIQVGDFGYWPSQPDGEYFLDVVNDELEKHNLDLWFCDGNHEDHRELQSQGTHNPRQIREHIKWMPRGHVETVAERRILFFGGAVSVDRYHRRENISWFHEELPTEKEWQRAYSAKNIDIIISHDAPTGGFVYETNDAWPAELVEQSLEFRQKLKKLGSQIQPTHWYCGHHHRRVRWVNVEDSYQCDILNCDGSSFYESVTILDI